MKQLEQYLTGFQHPYSTFDKAAALSLYKTRNPFSHKGSFGHVLLLAGSYGKIGACILASKACLAAGAGLLTTYLPSCGYEIMQSSVPEAMVMTDDDEFSLTGYPLHPEPYQAVGIGPGIGTGSDTVSMLTHFLKNYKQPMVIDADALNIISQHTELLHALHPLTIITPHPKEFDRLFGESDSDLARFEKARKMASTHKIIIVLKGRFTGIFKPDGSISFNVSGNAGMAKGGSGDALTGIIAAMLAQSYEPAAAAALGAYLHGAAGDIAAGLYSQEAMLPSDLIRCIGNVFLDWNTEKQNHKS